MSRDPKNDVLFQVSTSSPAARTLLTYRQSSIRMEPRFGSFAAVHNHDDGFVYAYGHASDNSKDVMLARVLFQAVQIKVYYEYYDGHKFQTDMSKCKPVFTSMQNGSIYRSKLFEPHSGKDWVFIGCTSVMDNKVQIGVAAKPEGPWDFRVLLVARPRIVGIDQGYSHFMYAHPWAFDEADGQLMITWSEGREKGKVFAVKVTLAKTSNDTSKASTVQVEELQGRKYSLKEKLFGTLRGKNKNRGLEDGM
jgi:hypothetical protein